MGKRNKQRRDPTSPISNRRLPFAVTTHQKFGFTNLRTFEDRRTFHPEGPIRPALRFSGVPARLRLRRSLTRRSRPQKNFSGLRPESGRSLVAFRDPDRVLICVRRKMRREVLFAKRKTGRGGQKPPKYSWFSKVTCRRS